MRGEKCCRLPGRDSGDGSVQEEVGKVTLKPLRAMKRWFTGS